MGQAISSVDPDMDIDVDVDEDVKVEKIINKDGETIIIKMKGEDGQERTRKHVIKERKVVISEDGKVLSEVDMEKIMAEVREGLADVDEVLAETDVIIAEAMAEAGQHNTVVKMECSNDPSEISTVVENDEGRTVMICKSRIMAQALSGLEEARNAIANNPEMPAEIREQVLESLDEQIEQWKDSQG